MAAIPTNIAAHVGCTPMVELARMLPDGPARLFAKLEAFNPGGSVKDRIGVAMIEAAERDGIIEPGRTTIVEATSGNTGIALAFVCAAKGYDLVLTMPQGMSREREGLLRLYGARVEITESLGGMNEAVDAARAMASARRRVPARPVLQSGESGDPPAHHRTRDMGRARRRGRRVRRGRREPGGRSPASGRCSRRATRAAAWSRSSRAPRPCCRADVPGRTRSRASAPASSRAVLNRDVLDEVIAVDDEDAIETARELARREGVLAGISGGAAVWAAIEVARRPESRGARIVTILPDSGER